VSPLVETDGRTAMLGHSLGGVVALAPAAELPVVTLAGLGHNAHVESPERCGVLLD
jgi:pimeloyl-ACP methyl ester carboxylesterase